ncbi:MAG: DUF4783 domain-containing protein [Cyclobacteriaceae bacterium]|nr:DUF4783 domain-containing protein [Cyclobacteriaceae bacterium]
MKYSILSRSSWFLSLFLLSSVCFAQADIINDVKEAIKLGASKEIVRYLNANVDITINGNMDSYSRTQAEFVLKEFFKKNPPSSFVIVHQGASKGGSPYATGQYASTNENVYLVWVRIKKINNTFLIHEMSFIKE